MLKYNWFEASVTNAEIESACDQRDMKRFWKTTKMFLH
jgi:hypothetical protein